MTMTCTLLLARFPSSFRSSCRPPPFSEEAPGANAPNLPAWKDQISGFQAGRALSPKDQGGEGASPAFEGVFQKLHHIRLPLLSPPSVWKHRAGPGQPHGAGPHRRQTGKSARWF